MEKTPNEKNDLTRNDVDRGHLISSGFVKSILGVSSPTFNYWNKFLQYKAANRGITRWEKHISDIAIMCLNTKGLESTDIEADFYMISGTKPYNKQSSLNIKSEYMAIPQLQWTAMCCRMKIDAYDIVMSGGYIGSNRKPDPPLPSGNEEIDKNEHPVFPPLQNNKVFMYDNHSLFFSYIFMF